MLFFLFIKILVFFMVVGCQLLIFFFEQFQLFLAQYFSSSLSLYLTPCNNRDLLKPLFPKIFFPLETLTAFYMN